MTSPAHWLIFSLVLRQIKSDVITYDQCREIARQCGLADEELDKALHFIHSKMGLIRYFLYEEIKHLVVLRPQFLFDKVTEMIINTFTLILIKWVNRRWKTSRREVSSPSNSLRLSALVQTPA